MHRIIDLGTIELQSGRRLPGARLSVECHGQLDTGRSNAVLIFTPFGSRTADCRYLFGSGRPIDPERHFIVVLGLFGNGESSSPSNSPAPCDRTRFPAVTIRDNVLAQHHWVTRHLGVREVALALGHSMGAMQAYHWAALFPTMVRRLMPICGAARTSMHNALFLSGIASIIRGDPAWRDGDYPSPPLDGLLRAARVWSAWAPSPGFYREEGFRRLGFASLDDYLAGLWESNFRRRDANDILCQVQTWIDADVSRDARFGGDLSLALAAIEARTIVMPGETDCYFPKEDSMAEVALMRHAQIRPIPSPWGHWAGNGRRPEDLRFIDEAIRDLFEA